MICEIIVIILGVGFVLEKLVELKLLTAINSSNVEIVQEMKKNGVSKNAK